MAQVLRATVMHQQLKPASPTFVFPAGCRDRPAHRYVQHVGDRRTISGPRLETRRATTASHPLRCRPRPGTICNRVHETRQLQELGVDLIYQRFARAEVERQLPRAIPAGQPNA